jgi:hypothetical protein
MANNDDTYGKNDGVGYGQPPSHTKFVKGQSGNPAGRPKGSQNLSTILDKIGRERVRVTENGRARYITKKEATMLQLMNKAVAGDLNAARLLLSWLMWLTNSAQTAAPLSVLHERDKLVEANLIERIRQSEDLPQENNADPMVKDPSEKEE